MINERELGTRSNMCRILFMLALLYRTRNLWIDVNCTDQTSPNKDERNTDPSNEDTTPECRGDALREAGPDPVNADI